ncbi:hypothetical protein AB1Y20_016030 [Prymnesium parvum]|uniref:Sugar phosphate transporter domain-containing protein n=1 Tax=Prymnesium parvum TaxID=97485 RepID=A0AB34K068_PRYPA
MSSNLALLGCVLSVWASWSVHDYLQERIFRIPGFEFGFFMAFVLQSSSFLLSAVQSCAGRICSSSSPASAPTDELRDLEDQEARGSLLHERALERRATFLRTLLWYLLLSVLIAGANGMATAALNFVNMQVKVLFKSSKIVTVMLIGCFFGRHYQLDEYGCMLLVAFGLIVFFLAGGRTKLATSLVGGALLVAAVLCDSVVPNVQQRLLQDLSRPKSELVFHTNWMSALFTLVYITATGELFAAVTFLRIRRRAMLLLLLQSVAGYLGIISYLETVRRFGSKVTTVVTSCRKCFTIVLSVVLFGHVFTGFHLAGLVSVFTGVLLNVNLNLGCSRVLLPPALFVASVITFTLVSQPSQGGLLVMGLLKELLSMPL